MLNCISAEGCTKNGKKKRYYACNGRKKNRNGCENKSYRQEVLEELVLKTVVKKLSSPKIMTDMVQQILATHKQTGINNMLAVMLKEREKVERALDNLVTAIENGMSSPTTNKHLHELEEKKEKLDCSILIEQSKTETCLTESDVREYYEEALQREPVAMINSIVKEILVYNDRIKIIFNTPIMNGPDESQSFSFYTEVEKIFVPNTCSAIPKQENITMELAVY